MALRVVCLPGDGIGPEVTAAAVRVLEALPLDVELEEHLFGGAAIHATGEPLPQRTLDACLAADAVLLGAVGLPEFDGKPVRPEQGLIRLRRQLASVDKANVMETSRLWRETATSLAPAYPDVELRHVLADTAGLLLAQDPARFDVIVTENTFGDLLSDVAAGATGGLGLAAS